MLIFVENKLNEAQIPEVPNVQETEEEKSKSFEDLRKFYVTYAKRQFQGKSYRNKSLNEDIRVSRDGIDKLEGMISFREQCLAIQRLDKFLTDSVIEDWQFDKKNRRSVDKFIYLICRCKINNKPYKIRTTIKKTLDNPLKFYFYILDRYKNRDHTPVIGTGALLRSSTPYTCGLPAAQNPTLT